jgi:putative sterol carrier protein
MKKYQEETMAVSTPKEFIEVVLPSKLTTDKLEGLDMTIQFNITGVNAGDWFLSIKNKEAGVQAGTTANPTISLKMKDDDFVKLVNGELSGQKAFMTGKLKFKGSMTAGIKMQKLGII